jgi:hypothetical protein
VGVILNGDLQTQTGTLLWQKFIMTLLTPRHLGTPMNSNPQNSFFLFLSYFKY